MKDPELQARHLEQVRAGVAEREGTAREARPSSPAELEWETTDRPTEVRPVRGVREPRGSRRYHRFPWPRFHAFLLRTRRLLMGLVIANMVLAVLGMAILGPWGFIPATTLVLLVPLLLLAIGLDERAVGATDAAELEHFTDEESVEHPEDRSASEAIAAGIDREESYTPGETRKIAIFLILFAGMLAIVALVASFMFGAPLLGFGALFIFGYVALLSTFIGFAGMHEMYEEEHHLQEKQYKEQ